MDSQDKQLPLYVRVQDYIRAAIGSEYQPGDLLPSQQEIARATGTSLITVKRAIDELARQRLLESVRGRGTVVKRRPEVADQHQGVSSWTDSISGLGMEPRTAWTKISERVPPKTVKGILGLKARKRTVVVERLRTVDGSPFCLMSNELPADLTPGFGKRGMTSESIYKVLEDQYDLCPAWADEEVSARESTVEEKRYLGRDARIVVEVHRTSYLADGRPLEIAVLRAPAHSYRYRVQVRR